MEKIYISSRQNAVVSQTAKLSDRKYRDVSGLFLLDGVKLLCEAVSCGVEIEYVLCTEAASERYADEIALSRAERIYVLSEPAFERVTDEKSPEGIVTTARCSDSIRRDFVDADADCESCRLLLDGIQNPDNLGAILRSSHAFGQKGIILGAGCADIYGRRVMRSSMGAALRAGTLSARSAADACRAIRSRGHRVVAATMQGAVPVTEFDFRPGDCIVIGNEGHGIERDVLDAATDAVYIPMAAGQESLNASCAAAVILWEVYKRSMSK